MKRLDFASKGFFRRLEKLLREEGRGADVTEDVARIIREVGGNGDRAVADYTEKFDRVRLAPARFRVDRDEIDAGLKALPADARRALREAVARVKEYNRRNLPRAWKDRNAHGAEVGERFYPIRRVGVYVPGGRVPLLSTAIMTLTLAGIARVPEVAVFTPPGTDGNVPPATLAAIKLSGAGEVYRVGGVQAMAAMALGTEHLPRVDKIFGPGNAWVVEAKRQVFGRVGIDLLPGPSEVMIIADASARPDWVAADLLAQAEHGHGGKLFLVTTEPGLIEKVSAEVRRQARGLKHREVAEKAMREGFFAIRVEDNRQAAEVANFVAPEHLELQVRKTSIPAFRRSITTAGAVLEGAWTPAVLGDFVAGPSHVLPTGRSGRFFSGLRVTDFMRRTSVVAYDRNSLKRALPVVEAFSRLEDLDAHGVSAAVRFSRAGK